MKFRGLLAEGVDVNWGKQISGFETGSEGEVEVKFADGATTKGSLLVGVDGSSSRTRRLLVGDDVGKLYQLPIRFMGVTVRLTAAQIKPLRDIDPLLFQGCHPDSGVFMWFSTLSTPEVNGSAGEDEYYEGQLNLSWRVKGPEDEVPEGNRERVAKMKKMTEGFEPRLKKAIDEIPNDSEVLEIKLQDWPTLDWPTHDGRITLLGDAAHAMTMCKFEAQNVDLKITDQIQIVERLPIMASLTRHVWVSNWELSGLIRSPSKREWKLSRVKCVPEPMMQCC